MGSTQKCHGGELIKLGAKRKWEKDTAFLTLLDKIAKLESLHKHSLSVQLAYKLLELQKELQMLLESKARQIIFFKKGVCYEQ